MGRFGNRVLTKEQKASIEENAKKIVEGVLVRESGPQNIAKQMKELANQMKTGCQDKPDRLVPIYDIDGNLWWPKRMSREEVKKMVAERETSTLNTENT